MAALRVIKIVLPILSHFIITWQSSFGQIIIAQQKEPQSITHLKDSWNFTLKNQNHRSSVVYLLTSFSNFNGPIDLEVKSESFEIMPGEILLMPHHIKVASINYFNVEMRQQIKRTGILPDGDYQICTEIRTADDDIALAKHCFHIQNRKQYKSSEKKGRNDNGNVFSTTGEITLEQFHTFPNHRYNLSDEPFTRLHGQVGLNILDIPIQAQFRLTTEKNLPLNSPQAFSISFDARQFKTQLTKRLENKLRKQKEQLLRERAEDIAKINELSELEDLIQGDSTLERMTQIRNLEKKLDSLEKRKINAKEKFADHHQRMMNAEDEAHKELETKTLTLRKQLEAKSDSVINELDDPDSIDIHAQIDQWKNKLDKLEQQQKEYEKLRLRYRQLHQFKENLEQSNDSPLQQLETLDQFEDPEFIQTQFREEVPASQRYLLAIEEFNIGTVTPRYAPLIIEGLEMNGGNIALSNHVDVTAAIGIAQTNLFRNRIAELQNDDSTSYSVVQSGYKVLTGQVGKGSEKAYLNLTALHASAQNESLSIEEDMSNNIFGIGGHIEFFSGYARLENYFAYAMPKQETGGENFSDRMANQVRFKLQNENQSTCLNFSSRFIGPGYRSIGTPFLRSDRIQYSVQMGQWLLKRKIKGTIKYSSDLFNHIQQPENTVTRNLYGGSVALSLKKWPRIHLNYTNIVQQGAGNSTISNSWQLLTNQSYKLGQSRAMVTLSYHIFNNRHSNPYVKNSNHQVQIRHTLMPTSKWSLSSNLFYQNRSNLDLNRMELENGSFLIHYRFSDDKQILNWAGVENLLNYSFSNKLDIALGIQLLYEESGQTLLGGQCNFKWKALPLLHFSGRVQHNRNERQNTFIDLAVQTSW